MLTITNDILLQGQSLVFNLQQEGRAGDAKTVAALLEVVSSAKQEARFLTTGQVASRLGVSRQTIVNWVKREIIPGIRLGGRVMIPATALASFAKLERILDDLDAEHMPLASDEAAKIVSQGRENFIWQSGN